jgi:hypothetical protein
LPTCEASRFFHDTSPGRSSAFVAYLTSPAADRLLIEEASQLPYRRGLASDIDSRVRSRVADALDLRASTSSARVTSISTRYRRDVRPDLRSRTKSLRFTAKCPCDRPLARAAKEATGIVNARWNNAQGTLMAAPYATFLLGVCRVSHSLRARRSSSCAGIS